MNDAGTVSRMRRLTVISDSPSAVALGRFLSMGFSLLTAPLIARSLGVEGRGYVAGMLALIAVAPVMVGLGVPLAVRRRVLAGFDRTTIASSARSLALLGLAPSMVMALGLNGAFSRVSPRAIK